LYCAQCQQENPAESEVQGIWWGLRWPKTRLHW